MVDKESLPSFYLEYKTLVKVLKDLKLTLDDLEKRVNIIEERLKTLEIIGKKLNELQILNEKIESVYSQITNLNKKFEEEVEDSETVVNRIVAEIRNLIPEKVCEVGSKLDGKELTVVERKRINEILNLLKEHEKLTSSQLSEMLGLSRTRCNEYFKLMERLGMVEPILMGKEKFYALKTNLATT